MPEPELWPNEATSSAVGRALTDVEAIARRAADEGFGELVDVAQDTIAALDDLATQIDATIDAQDEDGDRG
ncbi:hypothetical protein [Amycolatopsis vancoresmycina]|uniref:Uncharacterized protein n=1 Tax=Amycolatopsis vancoresmycina DSM 44592 TaxID=1292037 RepID=R1I8Y2_9PSEU|nr:hypothetical protein [Amycolatopsis vancoresmycina]EOD66874.1 hypothetical protein H480_19163 [Amycolatopsis vancoresmycina DSM 44592]